MKIKILSQKKEIHIYAVGKERKVLNLIAAFAGDSIKNVNNGTLRKLMSSFIDKLVIDMTDKTITKEFIQLLLRMQ